MKKIIFLILTVFPILSYATNTISIIESISASTHLTGNVSKEFDYSVSNLIDDDLTTAWFEGENEQADTNYELFGAGSKIQLHFYKNEQLDSISIANGYGKSNRHFRENGRLTQIMVTYDTGRKAFTLKDTPNFQTLDLGAIKTKSLSIRIIKAKAGTKYSDIGFSELKINVSPKANLVNYSDKLKTIKNELDKDDYGNGRKINSDLLSDLSDNEFALILAQDFKQFNNSGALDRTVDVLMSVQESENYRNLIPPLLKERKEKPLLLNYASTKMIDAYIEQFIISDLAVKIAFLHSLKSNEYVTYYRLVELGDARAIRKLFDIYASEGISEYATPKMPDELLKPYKGKELNKIILEYKERLQLNAWTWEEIKKLLQ